MDHQGLSCGPLIHYKGEPLKRELPLGGATGVVGLVSSVEPGMHAFMRLNMQKEPMVEVALRTVMTRP